MINSIYDEDKQLVVNKNNIKLQLINMFAYGVPLSVKIGISDLITIDKFEVDKTYYLLTDEAIEIKVKLFSEKKEIVSDKVFTVFRFVSEDFYKLLHNNIRTVLQTVNFKTYIVGAGNQLDYFILGLRKKALMMTLDNNLIAISKSIFSAFSKEPIDFKDEILTYKKINDISHLKQNYYTILTGNKYPITEKGLGLAHYMPFVTNADVKGLNNFITPRLELNGVVTHLSIGDIISIEDNKYAIIEKEIFIYNGKEQVFLVAGDYK